MQKHVLALTTYAFILACGAAGASAEESPGFMAARVTP